MPRYSDEALFELAREACAELGPAMNQSDFGRRSGYSSVLIPRNPGEPADPTGGARGIRAC